MDRCPRRIDGRIRGRCAYFRGQGFLQPGHALHRPLVWLRGCGCREPAARYQVRQTAEAMAVAGVLSPGLSAAGYSKVMGNHAKEGIPWATMTGLWAADLAAGGFTGPLDILDHPDYYDAAKILAGLGEGFAVDAIYFKPYACCRWIHSALDGLVSPCANSTALRLPIFAPSRCTRLTECCG